MQGSLSGYGNSQVGSLLVSGTDLYAGGSFAGAGGVPANGIAKWDRSTWSALGTGMNRPVFALAITGSDLFAGGSFATAGGKVSAHVARAYLIAPPGGIADSITGGPGAATINFYGNPGRPFDVEPAVRLTPPVEWSTLTTTPRTPGPDGAFSFTDPGAPAGRAFYRGREK